MFYTTSFSPITTKGLGGTSGYDTVTDICYDTTVNTSKYETYCKGYEGNGKVYFRKSDDNILYIHCTNTGGLVGSIVGWFSGTSENPATNVYFAPDSSSMFKDMTNLKYLTVIDDMSISGKYISNINSFCENTSVNFDYTGLLSTFDSSVSSVTANRAFYCTNPSKVNISAWDMTKFSSVEDMFGPGVSEIILGKMKADTSFINAMFQSATGITYLDPGYITSGKVYGQQPNKLCKYSKSSTYDIDSHNYTYHVESPSQTIDITTVRQFYKIVDFAYLNTGDVFNYTIKSLISETDDSSDEE